MKKFLTCLASAMLLVLGMNSCIEAPQITLSVDPVVTVAADGSSATISFTANRDWSARSSESWVTLNPSSGTASAQPVTVTAKCEANTTYNPRSATVTIYAEDAVQSVRINQDENKGLIITTLSYDVPATETVLSVNVETNVQFSVDIPASAQSWISYQGTKAVALSQMVFKIAANNSDSSREAKITVTPAVSGVATQVITVRQARGVPATAVDLGVSVAEGGYVYKLYVSKTNLGANTQQDYGGMYAWGNPVTQANYSWPTYKWGEEMTKLTKYCPRDKASYWGGSGSPDGKYVLEKADDAATVKMGEGWHIPTSAEMKALIDQCTWTWTTVGGKKGYEVKSKQEGNNNSVFIPAAGYGYLTMREESGVKGRYWTSNLGDGEPFNASALTFTDIEYKMLTYERCNGFAIRPVFTEVDPNVVN